MAEKTFAELLEIPGALVGKYVKCNDKKYMCFGDERLAFQNTKAPFIIWADDIKVIEWAKPGEISEWNDTPKKTCENCEHDGINKSKCDCIYSVHTNSYSNWEAKAVEK